MPNFAQAALSGYQAGATIGKQRRVDAALGNIDLTRPETLLPVLREDPTTGVALIGASAKMAEYRHDLAGRAALSDYLTARMGLPGGSASPGATPPTSAAALSGTALPPAAAPSAVTPAATAGDGATPQDIIVTAPRPPQPSQLEEARANLIRNDPEGYLKIEQQFATMTDAQRKSLDATTSAFDGVLQGLKTIPETNLAARQAYIQSHRADWVASGIPAEKIDGFMPTDANIADQDNRVLGIKGILERQDKDRTFAQTVKHQTVEEQQGAARIGLEGKSVGIAGGQLKVAQGRLSLARTVAGTSGVSSSTTSDLLAIARGQKGAPKPTASDIFAIAGEH